MTKIEAARQEYKDWCSAIGIETLDALNQTLAEGKGQLIAQQTGVGEIGDQQPGFGPVALIPGLQQVRLGIERPYCFHSLRHYSASYLHAIGIPDAYIMERGGWSTPHVMQKVYRHALADRVDPMALKAVSAFQNSFQPN